MLAAAAAMAAYQHRMTIGRLPLALYFAAGEKEYSSLSALFSFVFLFLYLQRLARHDPRIARLAWSCAAYRAAGYDSPAAARAYDVGFPFLDQDENGGAHI